MLLQKSYSKKIINFNLLIIAFFSLFFSLTNTSYSYSQENKISYNKKTKINLITKVKTKFQNIANNIQDHLRDKNAPLSVQLFFTFLLGLLMSLTPCIYPTLTLTIGALQGQKTNSLGFSFLLALFYGLGISITFATLGLIAATSGQLFGNILSNPIFICALSSWLLYMGLAMFGLYEMYIPRFLQTRSNNNLKSGSLLAAFSFGAISGTIASPCISPGLALLLTIVASMANKVLGFILLFSFGFGLSLPIIILGTFSSSINLLPQSGTWMLEVKKLFGILIAGLSLYFLNNVLADFVIYILALILSLAGVIYVAKELINNIKTKTSNIWNYIILIIFLLLTYNFANKTYSETKVYFNNKNLKKLNYDQAKDLAIKTNKNLLLDFGAEWCSICKKIDRKIFNNPEFKDILSKFIFVKIDATDSSSEIYNRLSKKYKIIGVPVILVTNPSDESIIKRWGGELFYKTNSEVIKLFENQVKIIN